MSNLEIQAKRPSESWALHRTVTPLTVGILFVLAVLFAFSAKNMELDTAVSETGSAVTGLFGFND